MCGAGVFVRAATMHTYVHLVPTFGIYEQNKRDNNVYFVLFNKIRWHKTMIWKKRMRSQLPSFVCMHVTLSLAVSFSLSLGVCVY